MTPWRVTRARRHQADACQAGSDQVHTKAGQFPTDVAAGNLESDLKPKSLLHRKMEVYDAEQAARQGPWGQEKGESRGAKGVRNALRHEALALRLQEQQARGPSGVQRGTGGVRSGLQ